MSDDPQTTRGKRALLLFVPVYAAMALTGFGLVYERLWMTYLGAGLMMLTAYLAYRKYHYL